MKRYGKPSQDWLNNRPEFFSDNQKLLDRTREVANLYLKQPPRTKCKICKTPLKPDDFSIQGVGYSFCDVCGHLNGAHEDTDAYCDALYVLDGGEAYGSAYIKSSREAFFSRLDDIYQPKVDFLIEALKERGESPENLKFCDWGAGAGYLVGALQNRGCLNSFGYEVSTVQRDLGNTYLKDAPLKPFTLGEDHLLDEMEVDVISIIFVLEHVQDPENIFRRIKANKNIKYFYFAVPLFSLSAILETVFDEVKPRTLSPEHTHMFTEASLDYLCEKIGMKRVAEWWFGTSVVDLYRSLEIATHQTGTSKKARKIFGDSFLTMIDDLQLVLDKHHASSEVHMLLSCE